MIHWRRGINFAHDVVTICGDTHEGLDAMYQIHNPKIHTIDLLTLFNFSLLPKPWSGSFLLCGVAKG
jgi:hypothetical protein